MNIKEFLLLLASIAASVGGQFFLKAGAIKLGKVTADNVFSHIIGILSVPELLLGLLSYGIGAIAYILLLTRVKLSIAGPSAALIYICTVFIGCLFFQEQLPIGRAMGLSFITLGVVLVLWKY